MRNKIFFITCIFILTVVAIRCSTKCPGFDKSIILWMPYNTGDTLLLKGNSYTDTLIVKLVQANHSDKLKRRAKCVCENSYIISISSNKWQTSINYFDSKDYKNSNIVINNEWLDFSNYTDTLYIGGTLYTDLLIYKNRTIYPDNTIESVIVSKNQGIVAFCEKNDSLWITDKQKNTGNIITYERKGCE